MGRRTKALKFVPHLIDLILTGEKTAMWRVFDDKDIAVGDILMLTDAESKEVAAMATVTRVSTKLFRELNDQDWDGHERYKSEDEMISTFQKFYGSNVNLDTEVKMIDFKLDEQSEIDEVQG